MIARDAVVPEELKDATARGAGAETLPPSLRTIDPSYVYACTNTLRAQAKSLDKWAEMNRI